MFTYVPRLCNDSQNVKESSMYMYVLLAEIAFFSKKVKRAGPSAFSPFFLLSVTNCPLDGQAMALFFFSSHFLFFFFQHLKYFQISVIFIDISTEDAPNEADEYSTITELHFWYYVNVYS